MKWTWARLLPAAIVLTLAMSAARGAEAQEFRSVSPTVTPALAPQPIANGTWSLYSDPPPPPPPQPTDVPSIRVLHTTVYDPVGDRVLVFGGLNSYEAFNDTWSLSPAGLWTQVTTLGTPPSPRRDQTSIYDPVRSRMVVFGGSGFYNTFMDDTHALSLGGTPTWSPVTPAGVRPPGRFSHTAIYDPVRDRMIVFGGYNGAFLNDVWQLTFSGTPTWSRIFPSGTPPSGRNALTAIYDPVRDRMLFFGGWDGSNFRSDVWGLNLSGPPAWTLVATSGAGPSARRHYAAIYDPPRDRLVVSGGEDWGGQHADSYALSLAGTPTWTAIAAGGSPPSPRSGHRAVLDPVRGRMIVFGGYGTNYLNDTNALSLAAPQTWSPILPSAPAPAAAPTPRRDQVAIYDPVRDRMLIFGGWDGGFQNDTWALSLSGSPTWTQLLPSGALPPGRFAHTAIYDDANDRLVVFGGYDGTFRNDVWALSLSGTPAWSQILPAGPAPAGRNAMTALYDPARQRLVLFGGWDGTAFRDDLWTLNLTGPPAWTQQTPANGPTPSARRHYAAIFDPIRDQMVMSGGLGSTYFNDTWMLALSDNDWKQLGGPSQQAPGERDGHRAIFDAARDRMVLFGGYGVGYMQDTWTLSLAPPRKWSSLSPVGTPPAPRLLYTAIYDPLRDRVLVYGGEGAGNVRFGDTWALDFASAAAGERPGQWSLGAGAPTQEAAPVLAMNGVRPNPWRGNEGLSIHFSLPGADPARIEVFTVSGQRVWLREVGGMGRGAHDVRFDPAEKLAPGLYMVRLSSPRGSFVTKVAKLR